MMQIIEIKRSATVLILEDSTGRRQWFSSRLPHALFAYSCSEAIDLLSHIQFDVIWLDWHLEGAHTSSEAARWIVENNYDARVFIHSTSPWGRSVLSGLLPRAEICEFGSFEIACHNREAFGVREITTESRSDAGGSF